MFREVWLGFSEEEMDGLLTAAGSTNVSVSIDRSAEAPQFQRLLAIGDKPSSSGQ